MTALRSLYWCFVNGGLEAVIPTRVVVSRLNVFYCFIAAGKLLSPVDVTAPC